LTKEPQQRSAHVGLCNSLAGRALIWARQGKYQAAVQEADSLAKEAELTGGNYYALGCVYARCSSLITGDSELSQPEKRRRAEEHATRALAMLRRALDKGYNLAGRKMADEDLRPLKDRPDFKQLLEEARKAHAVADR
jgi:hypothetical protein